MTEVLEVLGSKLDSLRASRGVGSGSLDLRRRAAWSRGVGDVRLVLDGVVWVVAVVGHGVEGASGRRLEVHRGDG